MVIEENSKTEINYWKEIEKNLSDELKNLQGIVLLTHNSAEFTDIIDFLKYIRKNEFQLILYISVVRSYGYMKKALELKPLDQKRMVFIDCVSGYAFPVEDHIDEAFYHKPPQNLDEMKEMIQFGIDKINPDMIIIDSLSQFINFSRPTEDGLLQLYEFLRIIKEDIINIMQNTFILLYDTKLSVMFYDTKLSATQHLPKIGIDHILKLEIVK